MRTRGADVIYEWPPGVVDDDPAAGRHVAVGAEVELVVDGAGPLEGLGEDELAAAEDGVGERGEGLGRGHADLHVLPHAGALGAEPGLEKKNHRLNHESLIIY